MQPKRLIAIFTVTCVAVLIVMNLTLTLIQSSRTEKASIVPYWNEPNAVLEVQLTDEFTLEFSHTLSDQNTKVERYLFKEFNTGESLFELELEHAALSTEESSVSIGLETSDLEQIGRLGELNLFSIKPNSEFAELYTHIFLFSAGQSSAEVEVPLRPGIIISGKLYTARKDLVSRILTHIF